MMPSVIDTGSVSPPQPVPDSRLPVVCVMSVPLSSTPLAFLFSLISVLGRWVGVQIVVLSELDGRW